eukprot:jgi/Mesen1/8963/ME000056S08371
MVLGLAVWPVLHEGSPTTMKWPEGERDEHDFKDGESLPTPLSVIQKETDEESNESTRDTWSKRISRFFRRKDNKRLKLNEE